MYCVDSAFARVYELERKLTHTNEKMTRNKKEEIKRKMYVSSVGHKFDMKYYQTAIHRYVQKQKQKQNKDKSERESNSSGLGHCL